MVDKLRLQFSLGSPIALRLNRQRKGEYFRIEGDDPNESTIQVAVSYISAQMTESLLPWLR